MFKSLTTAIVFLTLTSGAQAATYGFSFSNVEGAVAGEVAGYLVLPDGDGTFATTELVVTAAPPALGYTLDFNVLANFTGGIAQNSFTVSGGAIGSLAGSFRAFTSGFGVFALNSPGFGSYFTSEGVSSSSSSGVLDSNSTTTTYTTAVVAPVPLPAAAPLLLGALGSLALWGRKRRHAA